MIYWFVRKLKIPICYFSKIRSFATINRSAFGNGSWKVDEPMSYNSSVNRVTINNRKDIENIVRLTLNDQTSAEKDAGDSSRMSFEEFLGHRCHQTSRDKKHDYEDL